MKDFIIAVIKPEKFMMHFSIKNNFCTFLAVKQIFQIVGYNSIKVCVHVKVVRLLKISNFSNV